MSEELIEMTEEEALEMATTPEEEAVVEEPKKEYDLAKVQRSYEEMRQMDTTKMSRVDYQRYQWLEERLVDAGVIGELAWEEEFGA